MRIDTALISRVDSLANTISRQVEACLVTDHGWVALADMCDDLRKLALERFDQKRGKRQEDDH